MTYKRENQETIPTDDFQSVADELDGYNLGAAVMVASAVESWLGDLWDKQQMLKLISEVLDLRADAIKSRAVS